MNSAQCAICTESFDCPNADVSALQCGHVFHATCLTRWLAESSTCPQCRIKVTPKTVISKLFFCMPDTHEVSFSDGDLGTRAAVKEIKRLNEDLAVARVTLSERARELAKMSAEKRALEQKSSNLTEGLRSLESLHQKEVDSNRLLRIQLSTAQALAKDVAEAREVAITLQRKVDDMRNVQTVINGFQDEIDSMIRDNSDPTQLATWCAVLKSELSHKRKECRELNETLHQTKRNLETVRATLVDRTSELSASNCRVTDLEIDIAAQNKQITGLRKKIDALQLALGSPTDTAVGFARRLINESPAPSSSSMTPKLAFQTPKLSMPKKGSREIDLDTSIDLFATPDPPQKRPRPTVPSVKALSEITSNTARITSASSSKPLSIAPVQEARDICSRPVQIALDIIGKRAQVSNGMKRTQSAVFREGFNGFGGHEKVIMPRPKLLSSTTSAGSKKNVKKVFGPSKTTKSVNDKKTPPLPTLLSFMTNSDELT